MGTIGAAMRLARLALAATVGLVVAACTSSGTGAVSTAASSSSGSSTSSGSSASSSTSDPRTQEQIDADRAAAQAAVLKLSDLPTGWTSHSSTQSSGTDAVQGQLATCLGVDSSVFRKSAARVQSDNFDDPDDTMEVSNTVAVTASTSTANNAMDVYSKPEVPSCLGQAMDQAISQQAKASGTTLPAGTTIGKAQVAPESFPNVADRTTAYRVTVPLTTSGQAVNITIDYVIFVKGRSGSTLTLQGNGAVVPASLATSLAQTVAGRMPSS
jgi:hypothetical protein